MVLAQLGTDITNALRNLQAAPVIDEQTLNECLKEIGRALLTSDVHVGFVKELRNNVKAKAQVEDQTPGVNKRKLIQRCVIEELVRMLSSSRAAYVPKKGHPNVIMFVGLQGSGKTTTCTKYAYHYHRKGWKTALVCADTFRAGAFDQLKQNATKAKIPFYGSYSETDPVKIAEDGVEQFKSEKYDIIIVDTSGRHKQEASLFEEMRQVAEVVDADEVVFVMDSHIGQACFDQAKAFTQSVDVGSVIVTKLDGHAKGGGALSAVSATGSPIVFIGTGEHIDDFEGFEPKSFVSRLLGMGDITGLFNTIKEAVPLDKQPEVVERICRGQFSLRDMKEQFENVMRMGPLSKVMSMLPGFSSNLIPKGQEQASVARLKRFMTCMDSMNDTELDCEKPMNDSRILRVAKGSGTTVREVKELLEQHKQFSKMVGKMGKMGLTKDNAMQNMMRNPNQMMQRMQKMLDPKMLKQMGGAENMFHLMKEMGKAEDMEDMQDLMRKMSGGGR
eukprot:GHVS01068717.1.p1 GENE.GHVS01068717.1~~GHVS01068717.1.p1  ORF type:complete len:502 (+),score=85.58 GHVS01068717.1:63-1568(+)